MNYLECKLHGLGLCPLCPILTNRSKFHLLYGFLWGGEGIKAADKDHVPCGVVQTDDSVGLSTLLNKVYLSKLCGFACIKCVLNIVYNAIERANLHMWDPMC